MSENPNEDDNYKYSIECSNYRSLYAFPTQVVNHSTRTITTREPCPVQYNVHIIYLSLYLAGHFRLRVCEIHENKFSFLANRVCFLSFLV